MAGSSCRAFRIAAVYDLERLMQPGYAGETVKAGVYYPPMSATPFDPHAYLARLRLPAVPRPDEDGLEALHRAQAYTIPFENFDILLGRGISLEPAALVDKLVHHRRGGYCFELNSLLLMALEAFGFKARPLLARVHTPGGLTGRGHMLLEVTIRRRRWLADVGFGGPGLRAPIPLEIGRRKRQDGQGFRLVESKPLGITLQRRDDDRWLDLYSFDLGHVVAADIAYGNHFTSSHPSSFFTFTRVAALPLPEGRITLQNRSVRITGPNLRTELEIDEGPRYLQALSQHFGIDLGVPYEALKPLR
jgi:N-hydroxyarylamine O-acetyltransferase